MRLDHVEPEISGAARFEDVAQPKRTETDEGCGIGQLRKSDVVTRDEIRPPIDEHVLGFALHSFLV